MRKLLLISFILVCGVLLATSLTGCGSSALLPTTSTVFASIRNDGVGGATVGMTLEQRQAARLATKAGPATSQPEAITVDSGSINIYLWSGPAVGNERKVTDTPGAYDAVEISRDGTKAVFVATVNGWEQIFTVAVPATGQTVSQPVQLTSDSFNHYAAHISANGSKVAFLQDDTTYVGQQLCVISNASGATATCLDFSATTPVLQGTYKDHPSWTPDGKIVFEAFWLRGADEIFKVNADGSGLTQITNNGAGGNWDDCPSVSADGTKMVAERHNVGITYLDIVVYDLNTKQMTTILSGQDKGASSYDPQFLGRNNQIVFVSQQTTDTSYEIYVMNSDGSNMTRLTQNTYDDFFD